MMNKCYKGLSRYRYMLDISEQREQIKKLKEQGFKRAGGNSYNRVWKNEDTGECVIARYSPILTSIEDAKEVGE